MVWVHPKATVSSYDVVIHNEKVTKPITPVAIVLREVEDVKRLEPIDLRVETLVRGDFGDCHIVQCNVRNAILFLAIFYKFSLDFVVPGQYNTYICS